MSSYEMEQIFKKHSILDYLKSKDIYPEKTSGNKYIFKCPLPDHKEDNTPSFFVYDKGEKQDFFCYGCKMSGNIINLYQIMEKVSLKKSITRLLQDLNIHVDDVIDHLILEINNSIDNNKDNDDVWNYLLPMSCMTHNFLVKTFNDIKCFDCCENMYKIVDSFALSNDISSIEKINSDLPEILHKKLLSYNKEKDIKEIKKIMMNTNGV